MRRKGKRFLTPLCDNTIFAVKFYFPGVSTSYVLPKISRFINKKLYSLGLGSSLNRYDNSLTLYSAQEDKRLYSSYSAAAKFINFGSGAFFHNRWSNYDYPGNSAYYRAVQGEKNLDFCPIDLCDDNFLIPEKDGSVDLIYCSHTLEHLNEISSIRFIKECHRLLKKGGVMRVALPNIKNDFDLLRGVLSQKNITCDMKEIYISEVSSHIITDMNKLNFESVLELLRQALFESHAFYKESINRYPEMAAFDGSKPERHISYWDFDDLTNIACEAGFQTVVPNYQGGSVAPPFRNLHVFDSTEPHMSWYADLTA